MIIYAISGKAEHGKNFTADIIKDIYEKKYSKKVCLLANGDYVKFLSKYVGWDGTKSEEMRKLLQEFGTDYIRDTIDADFWVNEIVKQINILKKYFDVFVICDTRFINEIKVLKDSFNELDNSVISVRVVRFDFDGSLYRSKLTKEQLNHPSETSLDEYNFDYYIINQNKFDTEDQVLSLIDNIEGYYIKGGI